MAALVFQVAPFSRFHSSAPIPLSHSSPSLIDLLASMDVKQQKLTPELNAKLVLAFVQKGGRECNFFNFLFLSTLQPDRQNPPCF